MNLWSGAKSQSLGLAQKASAITALSITFAYMQEVGYNTALQRYILSNEAAILDGNTDSTRIGQLRSELASLGITTSLNQAERVFAPGFEQRKTFFAHLKKNGIAKIEQSIIARLSAIRINQGIVTPTAFRSQEFPEFTLHQIDCAADGLVAGLLGLASPPGLDVLFAVTALSYDLLSYAGAC